MSVKAIRIIDSICILLFVFIMVFIFFLPDGTNELLLPVFSVAYRFGAWIIGIGFLLTCLWGKGKSGIVLGIVMLVCYLITTFITLFGLIVLTSEWELLWYIHPVLIIPGCIIALWYRKRKKH